jgi:hypothetical protein
MALQVSRVLNRRRTSFCISYPCQLVMVKAAVMQRSDYHGRLEYR